MTPTRITLLTMLATLVALGLAGPAAAQVACNATITTDTTLSSSDPVTTGVCPANGINIDAENVVLDCGGLTIKGDGSSIGIRVLAAGVTIQNCVVDGFNRGIQIGVGGGAFVTNVVAQNSTATGVFATTDSNVFLSVLARNNGTFGFELSGTGNGLEGAVALKNGKAGFKFGGRETVVSTSLAISNQAEGFTGNMKLSSFAANSAISNTGAGFDMATGSATLPNDYSENKAIANGGNGLFVDGTNVDANIDGGGNSGLVNAGVIQCQIAGVACQ